MAAGNSILRLFGDGKTTTIANAGTVSGAIAIGDYAMLGFQLPAAFTGVAMTFQVSADGATYVPLRDQSGALITITVAQGNAYPFPDEVGAWPYVKLVSGTAEGGARTILIAAKA